jgi:NAD(P)-dependent dehydrogenase (short-subunit alcohol dehydrogenase family)
MKTVLVVGSTGQQGSSVVRVLSQSGRYFSLALTRNPSTPKAKQLAALENVQLVSGDLNDRTQLQSALAEANQSAVGPIWGVFVALAFPGLGVSGAEEETQGKVRTCPQRQSHPLICSAKECSFDCCRAGHSVLYIFVCDYVSS